MSRFYKIFIFSIALILCLSTTTSETKMKEDTVYSSIEESSDSQILIETNRIEQFKVAYTSHDPIVITNNSEFLTQGFTGYGNNTHPYVLEGAEIQALYYDHAIEISDTNASFLIANCSFISSYYEWQMLVTMNNVSNAVFENCFFKDTDFGMLISESMNMTLMNCTFSGHQQKGIWISSTNNTMITNCTFQSNNDGIAVSDGSIEIIDNNFDSNLNGVSLSDGKNCTIFQNTFLGDGILLFGSNVTRCIHNITSNTLNAKPIVYIYNQPSQVIDGDYGQVLLVNCTNSIVKDQNFTDVAAGVHALFSNFTEIQNVNVSDSNFGIIVYHSSNVSVSGSDISLCELDCIYLGNSANATIENCTLMLSENGVYLYNSSNVNITNNEIIYNFEYGIYSDSQSMTIDNNYFKYNGASSIYTDECDNGIFTDNTVNGTYSDLVNIDGRNWTISGNTLFEASFYFDVESIDKMRHTISSNTINGDPVIYHYNETGLTYDSMSIGQVILVSTNFTQISNLDFVNVSIPMILVDCLGCSIEYVTATEIMTGGIIRECSGFLISDVSLETTSATFFETFGFDITGYYFEINNANFTGFKFGVYNKYSINGSLKDCDFIDIQNGLTINDCLNFTCRNLLFETTEVGLWSEQGVNCTISDSSFNDSDDFAIFIIDAEGPGWNIIGNTFTESNIGIWLDHGFKDNITDNTLDTYHEMGIFLAGAENVTVTNNTLTQGFEDGLYIQDALDCLVVGNHIYWNNQTGLFIGEGEDCILYNNSFGGNGVNAEDYGFNNQWDDGISQGNAWSDYVGTGTYTVPGSAGSIDNFPTQIPDNDPPIISSPPDMSVDVLATSATITWQVNDLSLALYQILRNGTEIAENHVSDWEVEYDVAGTPAGVYNFTLIVNDTRGNTAFDTVIVTIVSADGFIMIEHNDDFATYGFPGAGTQGDPYRIENRTISGDATCIYIKDTTAHFVIRNCVLISHTSNTGLGIWFENVTNGIVERCTFELKQVGIYANDSPFIEYLNNTINYGETGIKIEDGENSTLIGNSVSNIAPPTSHGPLMGSYGGIILEYSPNSTAIENELINNTNFGLFLYSSGDSIINDNVFDECGILVFGAAASEMSRNTANGKPIFYAQNESNLKLDPDDYGQIILENCTDIEIQEGSIHRASVGIQLNVVSNSSITNVSLGNHGYAGILGFWSFNITLDNCTAYACYMGLGVQFCGFNITNSTFACNYVGIMGTLSETDIRDCLVFGNVLIGITVDISDSDIYDNIIAWNYLYNAQSGGFSDPTYDDGVSRGNTWSDYDGTGYYYVPNGGVDHYPNLITDSTPPTIDFPADDSYELGQVISVEWNPVDQYPGWYDIYVNGTFKTNGTWFGSPISYTPDFRHAGLYNVTVVARDAALNQVVDMVWITAVDSTHPTWVEQPRNQIVEYDESFIYDVNATDLDTITSYTVNDTAHFSISDTGLIQNSTVLEIGVYALKILAFDASGNNVSAIIQVSVVDSQLPTIDHPADVEYTEGTGGHSISWNVYDDNPGNWSLYLNGTFQDTDNWTSGSITISIDGLPAGVHNLTLIVADTSGNFVSDSVFVTVIESGTTTTGTTSTTDTTDTSPTDGIELPEPMVLVFMISGSIVIVVVVVVVLKRRGSKTFTP